MIWVIIGICCIILFLNEITRNKREKQQVINQIKNEYGNKPSENLKRSTVTCENAFHRFCREGLFYIDEITWNDLSMNHIFKRMNYTHCAAGVEYLYQLLKIPSFDTEILKKRSKMIQKFQQDPELRTNLSWNLRQIGFTGKYALSDYLASLIKLKPEGMAFYIILDLLYIPAIILLFVMPVVGLIVLFFVLFLNIIFYFRKKALMVPYLVSFSYILRMIRGGSQIASADLKGLEQEKDELRQYVQTLSNFSRFSNVAMSMGNPTGSSNPIDLILDYLKIVFHFDLIKFHQMLSECIAHQDSIIQMNNLIGYLDAMQSIACYRESLDLFCEPAYQENVLSFTNLTHPLVHKAIGNDLQTSGSVLLTGSNASGKSTFLKAIAINAIFAQTIMTCTAKDWNGYYFRVYTSMALKDNLIAGESYYMAEIKSLKRILDAAALPEQSHVLSFVDEVLRGTNTVERIAASSQILKSLYTVNMICFAATHDIELTYLLEKWYSNYHFEESMDGEEITFTYELQEGRATSRNAIRLLSGIGYDKDVIKDAEKMASDFLQNGKWNMNR